MEKALLIHPEELSKKWVDIRVELGVGTLALHPAGGRKADKTLSAMLDMLKTEKYREILDYALDRKMKIEYEFHAAGCYRQSASFA